MVQGELEEGGGRVKSSFIVRPFPFPLPNVELISSSPHLKMKRWSGSSIVRVLRKRSLSIPTRRRLWGHTVSRFEDPSVYASDFNFTLQRLLSCLDWTPRLRLLPDQSRRTTSTVSAERPLPSSPDLQLISAPLAPFPQVLESRDFLTTRSGLIR